MKIIRLFSTKVFLLCLILILNQNCSDNDTGLAPYIGSPSMSEISIEANSYIPKITWLGGYVSAIGVNKGEYAKIDSSLIWAAYNSPNKIKFPIQFASFPNGAQNILNFYGAELENTLTEDNVFTIWVVKDDVWNSISNDKNKYLKIDSSLTDNNYWIDDDTVNISIDQHTQITYPLDVFLNIDFQNTQSFGRLGELIIAQTDTSNNFTVSWNITQSGVTDTLISAMGICLGSQYDINTLVWEIYSEEIVDGEVVFGKKNVIKGPLVLGQKFNETRVFGQFPENGLERDQNYYLWIASKEWDGARRGRTVNGYAYMKVATR